MRVSAVSFVALLGLGCGSPAFQPGLVAEDPDTDAVTPDSDGHDGVSDVEPDADDSGRDATDTETATVSPVDTGVPAPDSVSDSDAPEAADAGPPTAVCGNGVLEAGEECDIGPASLKLCTGCEGCRVRQWLTHGWTRADGAAAILPVDSEACYEAWYKLDASVADGEYTILGAFNTFTGAAENFRIVAQVKAGSWGGLKMNAGAGANILTVPTALPPPLPSLGAWHHVAMCMGKHPVMTDKWYSWAFIDGKQVGSSNWGPAPALKPAITLVMGKNKPDTYGEFPGSIDEVRISSAIRYPVDTGFTPTRRHALDASASALYHLDGSGADMAGSTPCTSMAGMWGSDTGYVPSMCL